MSRERVTARSIDASEVEAMVAGLEKSIQAIDDSGLATLEKSIAKEDKGTVNESVPAGKAELKDNGDQNAKANDNWPVSEADRMKVARKLVTLAKELLEG